MGVDAFRENILWPFV